MAAVLRKAFEEFKPRYTAEAFSATTISGDEIRKRLGQGPSWVALIDGTIVGTVSAFGKGEALYVRSMGVLPAARGRRIGQALLHQVEGFAKGNGYQRFFLHTAPFLDRAIRLYEHAGYCRSNEPLDFYGSKLLTMVKNMDLRYPIGPFTWGGFNTPEQRSHYIDEIAATPQRMRNAVAGLSQVQLDTPYRDGGWTVRQVVHHVPDSHMNSYTRFKLAFTEHEPTIKPYDEAVWAELIDSKTAPIEPSLNLLEGLHQRWTIFLRSLGADDVKRKFNHPELGILTIDQYIALYAWHGAHHVAHITSLRERMRWN